MKFEEEMRSRIKENWNINIRIGKPCRTGMSSGTTQLVITKENK